MNFEVGKNLIGDCEITCPYCGKLNGMNKAYLSPKHLTIHKKTLADVRIEFPNLVTMTKAYYDKQKERAIGTKEVNCKYHNDSDCCKETKIVKKSASKYYLCDKCKSAGKVLDKRSSKEAYEKRAKGLMEKHGVSNPRHIPGVIEKTKKTNEERYGGTGFASQELAKKTRDTIQERFGENNVMKSKEGKELYIKSLQEKYGENITSPWNLLKVKKKISEQLIDYYKENEHHTSGKSYNEMYGETKSNKLITQRRESGAKSYRELLNSGYVASEQQIELFNIVKEIFPSAKLEYEQHCYFIDIAIPEYKIAIEFDGSDFFHGNSHDEKRDKLLKQFGWDTIRFKNKVPNINEVKIEIMKIRPHLFSFTG